MSYFVVFKMEIGKWKTFGNFFNHGDDKGVEMSHFSVFKSVRH